MVKGIEPKMPRDPGFLDAIKKLGAACKDTIANFTEREICAVIVQAPGMAEHVMATPDDLAAMGLTKLTAMDGDSGMIVRVNDVDPLPTTLSYGSLRAAKPFSEQPGSVEVAPNYLRKTYKTLTPQQQQIFGAVVQLAGRALIKIICFEDEGLKMAVALKDLPPSRARSLMVPIVDLGNEMVAGATIDAIVPKLNPVRGG